MEIASSSYQKCGEILTKLQNDKTLYLYQCLYCNNETFMDIDEFLNHQQADHAVSATKTITIFINI